MNLGESRWGVGGLGMVLEAWRRCWRPGEGAEDLARVLKASRGCWKPGEGAGGISKGAGELGRGKLRKENERTRTKIHRSFLIWKSLQLQMMTLGPHEESGVERIRGKIKSKSSPNEKCAVEKSRVCPSYFNKLSTWMQTKVKKGIRAVFRISKCRGSPQSFSYDFPWYLHRFWINIILHFWLPIRSHQYLPA